MRSQIESSAHLCADSRLIQKGDVYLAYPVGLGSVVSDNRAHIPAALAAGAALVLYEDSSWDEDKYPHARQLLADSRCIPVRGLSEVAGELADFWYQQPSKSLRVIGITGTNGKTSISHWIAQALGRDQSTAVMGTLGVGPLGQLVSTGFTTPDAPRVHRILAELKNKNIKTVAMEVSSHALDQGRVNAVHFNTAIFTNLTQDHLDYHGSMLSYQEAKRRLFDWPELSNAIIYLDDSVGASWINEFADREGLNLWAYGSYEGFEAFPESVRQKIKAVLHRNITPTSRGLSFECHIAGNWHQVDMKVVGDFNVNNALAVLCTLIVSGLSVQKSIHLIQGLHSVPGRMELVNPQDEKSPLIVVDFAHTPDALEKALLALRPIANARNGKLTCVFGCGGNRDQSKRPLMGGIASRLADNIVLTSDNPRDEDPVKIMDQIMAGIAIEFRTKVQPYPDRASAILTAVKQSGRHDILLIAGKGHETTQEIAGKKYPFSDVDHARLAIRGMA